MDSLVRARELLKKEVMAAGLAMDAEITVRALEPDESVGVDSSDELALRRGFEKIVQAEFCGSPGQAFTDMPRDWHGTLQDFFAMPLDRLPQRAFAVAALNAVLRHLGKCSGTVHCRNKDPETCGGETADMMEKRFGKPLIAMFGLQPFLLKALTERFSTANIRVADLNPVNIGTMKHGITIMHGENDAATMVEWCDVGFFTGSSITNGTFDSIRELFERAGKPIILFGNTISGVAALLNYDRFCPFGQ